MKSIWKNEKILPILIVLIAAGARFMLFDWFEWGKVNNDTASYIARSVGEMQFWCRMPIYQLFILLVRRMTGFDAGQLYVAVAYTQMVLGVAFAGLFSVCMQKLTQNRFVRLLLGVAYAINPCVIYWETTIMTESLALDELILLVWLLLLFFESPGRIKAFALGILAFAMIMTRPSYIILLPIMFLFWIIYYMVGRKNGSGIPVVGLGGAAVCLVAVLLYCYGNKQTTGRFMLSSISYINELSILIDNGLCDEDADPDIASFIREQSMQEDNSLTVAENTLVHFGYDRGGDYTKLMLNRHLNTFLAIAWEKWQKYAGQSIGHVNSLDEGNNWKYDHALQRILMPLPYIGVLILSLIGYALSFYCWIRRKRVPWMGLAFPTIIISIILLGFVTLTHATPQRICVCIIPLFYFLIAEVIGLIHQCFFKGNEYGNKA